jgi:hypothetical protein
MSPNGCPMGTKVNQGNISGRFLSPDLRQPPDALPPGPPRCNSTGRGPPQIRAGWHHWRHHSPAGRAGAGLAPGYGSSAGLYTCDRGRTAGGRAGSRRGGAGRCEPVYAVLKFSTGGRTYICPRFALHAHGSPLRKLAALFYATGGRHQVTRGAIRANCGQIGQFRPDSTS